VSTADPLPVLWAREAPLSDDEQQPLCEWMESEGLDPRALYAVEVVVLDGPCDDGAVRLSEDGNDVRRREPYLRPMRTMPPGVAL